METVSLAQQANILDMYGNAPPSTRALYASWIQASTLVSILPIETHPSGTWDYTMVQEVPEAGFRAFGDEFKPSKGTFRPETERSVVFGGDVPIDEELDFSNPNAKNKQVDQFARQQGFRLEHSIIKGMPTNLSPELVGLQRRVRGSQLLSNSDAVGGAGLSVLRLQELIDQVDDPTHIVMPRKIQNRLTAYAEEKKQVSWARDEWGKRITFFNGLPIVTPGAKVSSELHSLPFGEVADGGGPPTTCSVYVVSARLGGLHLFWTHEPTVRVDQKSSATKQVHISVRIGMVMETDDCVARLNSIADAEVTK